METSLSWQCHLVPSLLPACPLIFCLLAFFLNSFILSQSFSFLVSYPSAPWPLTLRGFLILIRPLSWHTSLTTASVPLICHSIISRLPAGFFFFSLLKNHFFWTIIDIQRIVHAKYIFFGKSNHTSTPVVATDAITMINIAITTKNFLLNPPTLP